MFPLFGGNWVYKYRMKQNNWFVKLVKTLRFHVVHGSKFRFIPIDLTLIIAFVVLLSTFPPNDELGIYMQLVKLQCKHVQCYALLLWLSLVELSKLQALNLYTIWVQFWYIHICLNFYQPNSFRNKMQMRWWLKNMNHSWCFFTFPCHMWIILNTLNSNCA